MAFGTNISTPLLLLYQDRLAASPWTVTALFAVYAAGLLPALLWGGPASDLRGRKRLSYPGLALSGIASITFILGASNAAMLYLARLLAGAASGVSFVVMSAWLAELAPSTEKRWVVRLTGMVMYAGFGLGPLMSGAMAEWLPYPLVAPYLIHLVVVGAGALALRAVPDTVTADPSERIRLDLGLSPTNARPFRRVVTPTAVAVFGFASLSFGLFPVLLRGAMEEIAIFITGVVSALTAFSIFATQRVSVRLGPLRAAPVAWATGTVGCALGAVAFATDWWGLILAGAVALGGASGLAVTSGLSFVDRLADSERRGAMTGAFYAVAYGGMSMPVVISTLAGPGGYGVVLALLTVTAAAGTLLLRRAVAASGELSEPYAPAPPRE